MAREIPSLGSACTASVLPRVPTAAGVRWAGKSPWALPVPGYRRHCSGQLLRTQVTCWNGGRLRAPGRALGIASSGLLQSRCSLL